MKAWDKTNPDTGINTYINADGETFIGLTKREHFAGLALQGSVANHGCHTSDGYIKGTMKNCVRYADALIIALNEDEDE